MMVVSGSNCQSYCKNSPEEHIKRYKNIDAPEWVKNFSPCIMCYSGDGFFCKYHQPTSDEEGWETDISCIVDCTKEKPCEEGNTVYEYLGYKFRLNIKESRKKKEELLAKA